MKLPFSIAARLVFRIIIPGLVFSAVILPAVKAIVTNLGLVFELVAYLSFLTLFFGWLVVLLDLPIYMLYEGRRFWPRLLKQYALRSQQKRLAGILKKMEDADKHSDDEAYLEAAVQSTYFPIGKSGEREAQYPSRLGNIMAEFEHYSTIKYGIDGIFYWYRIWLMLPKDLRDEIDEQKFITDCAVYTSFAVAISCFVMTIYAVMAFSAYRLLPDKIESYFYVIFIVVLLGFSYLLYRMSLLAHSQYGNLFKAMFDVYYTQLNVKPVLEVLTETTGENSFSKMEGREAYRTAYRFLQWHMARLPGETVNRNVEKLKKQREKANEMAKKSS